MKMITKKNAIILCGMVVSFIYLFLVRFVG